MSRAAFITYYNIQPVVHLVFKLQIFVLIFFLERFKGTWVSDIIKVCLWQFSNFQNNLT